jgi:hypothetical protein
MVVHAGTRFQALVDFRSSELRSEYVKGLSYTVGPADRALTELLPIWVAEGKVRLGGAEAEMRGEG